jgi:hypothetical protein
MSTELKRKMLGSEDESHESSSSESLSKKTKAALPSSSTAELEELDTIPQPSLLQYVFLVLFFEFIFQVEN